MKVAIIGGGAFGTMTGLRLAQSQHKVTIFERLPSLMRGASYNNQNRLHLGFHYPRDDETARQCVKGFDRFVAEFESCLLGNFPNAYFIASQGSATTPDEFLAFCERNQLAIQPIDLRRFRPEVRRVALGVLTQELVYDASLVRAAITERLSKSNVDIRLGEEVFDIKRSGSGGFRLNSASGDELFDAVVNCSYSNINRLTAALGHDVPVRQYEYTAVAIVELELSQPVGVTIMDGKFMTLLPFGKTGRYLLYHVDHVVIAREEALFMPPSWLDQETAPFLSTDKAAWFAKLVESSEEFLPVLAKAKMIAQLHGPRMVLARVEDTDARPSIVTRHEPRYITIFSGKIDHCTWVADEVASLLCMD